MEAVHHYAKRVGVGAWDRHGERTAQRMLVLRFWEAVEETWFASAAQSRAPGMQQIHPGGYLTCVCATRSWCY